MTRPITPKEPKQDFLQSYFHPSLLAAQPYAIDNSQKEVKLDQNENPFDLDPDLKKRIAEKLMTMQWNRYPTPFTPQITRLISNYAQAPENCILTTPGSNMLITVLFHALTPVLRGKIVIARPSFPLYEEYCRYLGLKYEVWPLNERLDYDLKNLPNIPSGSLIIFASPNNPVGNVLSKKDFSTLLQTYPDSLFIADEAYYEFAAEPYSDLLSDFSNLILVRTFSKTLGAAGVRLGYAIAPEKIIAQLTKLRLPYLINLFSLVVVQEIFSDKTLQSKLQSNVKLLCQERDKLFSSLRAIAAPKNFFVKESQANFLLIRFANQEQCMKAYEHLLGDNIQVRNVSKGPGLEGCLRVSIGRSNENQLFLASLKTWNF